MDIFKISFYSLISCSHKCFVWCLWIGYLSKDGYLHILVLWLILYSNILEGLGYIFLIYSAKLALYPSWKVFILRFEPQICHLPVCCCTTQLHAPSLWASLMVRPRCTDCYLQLRKHLIWKQSIKTERKRITMNKVFMPKIYHIQKLSGLTSRSFIYILIIALCLIEYNCSPIRFIFNHLWIRQQAALALGTWPMWTWVGWVT